MNSEKLDQSCRLVAVSTYWFGEAESAFERGDRRAFLVAQLAQRMVKAAHANLVLKGDRDVGD